MSLRMYRTILVLLLAACCLPTEQMAQQLGSRSFEKFFKHVKTIPLDSSVVVGQVWDIAVGGNGDMEVADRMTRAVYLFSPAGRLIGKLSTEACHPGFVWDPLAVEFNVAGEIYVMNNSAPRGHRFKSDGTCNGGLDYNFFPTPYFCFDRVGNMFGYYNMVQLPPLKKMDQNGKELATFGEFPRAYVGIIERVEGGGLVCDSAGNLYWAVVASPVIWKFDKHLRRVKEIKDIPSYFRQVNQSSVPVRGSASEIIGDVGKQIKGKTITVGLHLLNEDRLLIQYQGNGAYWLQVFDSEGNSIVKEDVQLSRPVMYARDRKIFFVEQPPPKPSGSLPNPVIVVYGFIPSQ
jgi:hypothetical protein